MELKDAILTLRGYNAWRRGGVNYKQPDPRVIGEAIDAVVDGYEALLRERDEAREGQMEALCDFQLLARKIDDIRDVFDHQDEDWTGSTPLADAVSKVIRERDEAREDTPWHANGETKDEWFARQREKYAVIERERDEAREDLEEWQTLRLWGAEPQHIHDFIKGQQTRIHEAQEIEKTCDKLERERDEARRALDEEVNFHNRTIGELVQAQRELQALVWCASWLDTLSDHLQGRGLAWGMLDELSRKRREYPALDEAFASIGWTREAEANFQKARLIPEVEE